MLLRTILRNFTSQSQNVDDVLCFFRSKRSSSRNCEMPSTIQENALNTARRRHQPCTKNPPAQDDQVRGEVLLTLEQRLRQKPGSPTIPDQCITRAAKYLEQYLFRTAYSFEDYGDLSTLDQRIQIFLTVQVKRRLVKNCKRNRTETLRLVMGDDRYFIVRDLVRQIKLEKNTKVASMKCSTGSYCPPNTTGGGARRSCSISFEKDTVLPQPVRNLSFGTALLDAFEKSPVERIQQMDWNALVAQAEENLGAYSQWAAGK